MEVRILEDFLAFAELRSFSRAAEKRHSTQSAFSRRIQMLEAWLGATLIDRRTVPARLTPAGELFVEVAEEALRTLRHGRHEVQAMVDQAKAVVSFAVTHSLSLTFFPRWIKRVEAETGQLSLRLLSHDGDRCRQAINDGECHFMIRHSDPHNADDPADRRLKSLPIGADRLIAVSAVDPVKKRPISKLPGNKNAKVPYLCYAAGSSIGRSLDAFLRTKEPFLEPCFETSLAEGVKAMVLEGHGIGWLPEAVVKRELASGELVRAGDESWDVDIEIRIYRATSRLPRHAEKLWSNLAHEQIRVTDFF
jgi:LysR family transcriptional regulator, hypochlorite-specific transcription factor HypT